MEIRQISAATVRSALPPRLQGSAKWDYGRCLIIAGSATMPGAASLCVQAAARSGVGLVQLASVEAVCRAVGAQLAECTYMPLPQCPKGGIGVTALPSLLQRTDSAAALVLGPGLGQEEDAAQLVEGLLRATRIPTVVDADGLNLLAAKPGLMSQAKGHLILTPHVVEFSRLSGLSVAEIMERPAEHTARFAQRHGVTVVLKGPDTHIAGVDSPDTQVWRHSRDNSGLAKGGSGDVLAGLMGGLLAQILAGARLAPQRAAVGAAISAVWLHSQAGWLAQARRTPYAMVAGDVIAHLPQAFAELLSETR